MFKFDRLFELFGPCNCWIAEALGFFAANMERTHEIVCWKRQRCNVATLRRRERCPGRRSGGHHHHHHHHHHHRMSWGHWGLDWFGASKPEALGGGHPVVGRLLPSQHLPFSLSFFLSLSLSLSRSHSRSRSVLFICFVFRPRFTRR